MKFSMAIEKKNRTNIGTVEGHNNRLHATKSQLPKQAWITPDGHHTVVPFKPDLLAKARGLAKRKDAVLAVEIVLQVGSQADWRDLPTESDPHGKRQAGSTARLNAMVKGAKEAAFAEFGEANILSIDLHTDESTPHIHVVFCPIFEGKLQAKRWLDGAVACAGLRERLHAVVSQYVACDYVKGAPGGEPLDRSKAAGGPAGPKPAPRQTMLEKASELLGKSAEIKALKAAIAGLNMQLQRMFSTLKRAEKRAAAEVELRKKADKKAQDMRDIAAKQRTEIKALEAKIEELTPKPRPELEKRPEDRLRPLSGPTPGPGKQHRPG